MKEMIQKVGKIKYAKIIIVALLVVIFALFRLKYTLMGTEESFLPVSSATLTVPKFSIYNKECCMTVASFKSFQNLELLQKELDQIMDEYEKISCGNSTWYYDSKHDVTIYEYSVEKGFIFNNFYIEFTKGKADDCSSIFDYEMTPSMNGEMKEVVKFTKDSKEHTIYMNCPTCFQLSNGKGGFYTINDWIKEYGNLDDFIKKLENDVSSGSVKKEIYKDGGTTLYTSRTLGLLKCNTLDGNQDIYIGDSSLMYEENYCK